MGRHSAAEDEDDDEDLLGLLGSDQPIDRTASAPVAPVPSPGRHAVAEDEPEPVAPTERGGRTRSGGGTRADLRLLRRNRALLARCVAALLVPFVLYSLVLELLGKRADYLLLIWLPAIVAGVLVGSFLDAAHRRAPADTKA